MKKAALFLYILIMMAGCKKPFTAPVVPQDTLVQLLTNSEWSVLDCRVNGANITPDFAGWRFKYYENKTVDAKFNGSVINSGTWDASQATMTSFANFTGATHPVSVVNGTWNFTPVSSRIVDLSQNVGTDTKTMRIYRE